MSVSAEITLPPDYRALSDFLYFKDNRQWDSRDRVWRTVREDPRLLLLFRWLSVPRLGRDLRNHPNSDIELLRGLLYDVTLRPELPDLYSRCRELSLYLDQKGY